MRESFLNDSKTINSLKTRISYGFTGNDNVNAYTTMSGLNLQTFYDFNNTQHLMDGYLQR